MDTETSPEWYERMTESYNADAVHTFILHSNIYDFVENTLPLKTFFKKKIGPISQTILFYDKANRIHFPSVISEKLVNDIYFKDKKTSKVVSALINTEEKERIPDGYVLEAFESIDKILRSPLPVTGSTSSPFILIDNLEHIAPNAPAGMLQESDRIALIKILKWSQDKEINRNGALIVLLTQNIEAIHSDLKQNPEFIECLEINYPNLSERKQFIIKLKESVDKENKTNKKPFLQKGFTVEDFANLASGLNLLAIENIAVKAEYNELPIDASFILKHKLPLIKQEYGDVIKFPNLDIDYTNVAGHAKIKEYFKRFVINKLSKGDSRGTPMGILAMGPPGTSKTLFARATAKECGINAVELNMGALKGSLVGESEKKMEKAIRAILVNLPTLVFIDEIDQSVSMNRQYTGDGGVSQGQFKRLMEIMSDTSYRGKILWFFATNRPDLLDKAFLREGRIDKKIPFLPPVDNTERCALINLYCKRYNYPTQFNKEDLNIIASSLENYTQAQIEAFIHKTYEICEMNNEQKITFERLNEACHLFKPSSVEMEKSIALAIEYCNDLDFIPEYYRQ